MPTRGKKPQPKKLKVLKGTARPCREAEELAKALPGDPVKPENLTPEASEIWDREVAMLLKRGIDLHGYELVLKIFCEEAAFIEREHAKQNDVSTAKITSARMLANEFFMTPASGVGKNGSAKKDNGFKGLGRKTG